jgi:hypothetical protein
LVVAATVIAHERRALSGPPLVVREQVEISAPILPDTARLSTPFPSTLDEEKALAHAAALRFDWLLEQCAASHPEIVLTSDPQSLTPEQLSTNYETVGRCAYEEHSSKPYWIPKLIDDVDICGTELGPSWRLIREDDLDTLSDADFRFVSDTLSAPEAGFFGSFYFSLHVWVRAKDGTIQQGTLEPGLTMGRVTPLDYRPGFTPTSHYEGGLALRCIRRADLR